MQTEQDPKPTTEPAARETVRIDDTACRCPDAKYTISHAVCNERQRRHYFACPVCSYAAANLDRAEERQAADRIRQRYGF